MPERTALLLLHGFSNTHCCWAQVRDAGLGEGRAVIAPDLRGHGDASGVRPVDLAGVLDDLAQITPARCVVAAYSQGGRIALHAALDPRLAPRVDRLVLISASPGIAIEAEREARRRADDALAASVEAESIEGFAQRWARTPVLAGLEPALAAEADADRRRNTPAGLGAALRGLGTGALPSLWNRLEEIRMPVLLIAGDRDVKFVEIAHQMAARLPEARVEVVPGAGHQVHLEQPDVVARLLG